MESARCRAGKLSGTKESMMSGERRQTPRKPATKFAHLRRKMEKARPVAKISKKK
jgi:hypothetical protein